MIKTNTTLVSVILQNNNISSKGTGMLFEALQYNYTITHFDISSPDGLHRNRLQGVGTEQLRKTLLKNDQLSVLNLSCTSMVQEGIDDLGEGMRRNYELVSLDVSFNNLSNVCGEILFQKLHSPCKIKWLDVSHNHIGDSSMSYLGGLLDTNVGRARLEKINISYCHISSIGIEQFLRFAEKNRYLQILQMNGNSFHQRNIICIKSFLQNNTSVWHLEMKNCFIQPDVGEALGDGLKKNLVIEQLHLGGNQLCNQGIIDLGKGLKYNKSLKVLDLKNNKFDTDAGLSFFNSIMDNNSLISIDLS